MLSSFLLHKFHAEQKWRRASDDRAPVSFENFHIFNHLNEIKLSSDLIIFNIIIIIVTVQSENSVQLNVISALSNIARSDLLLSFFVLTFHQSVFPPFSAVCVLDLSGGRVNEHIFIIGRQGHSYLPSPRSDLFILIVFVQKEDR